MASVNRVQILGNLGADPELRYTGSGKAVCELRVATTEKWGKGSDRQEKTEWHRVVVWDKTAEACAKYLAKGKSVFVEGRIQTRSYDDKQGQKRYITEIVANDVQFLGGGKGDRSGGGLEPDPQPGVHSGTYAPDDDIPFCTAARDADSPLRYWRRGP